MGCGCKKRAQQEEQVVQLPPMTVDLSITETQIREPQQPVSEDQTQQMMETVVKISETNL
jgi:hypothetical protein